MQIDRRTALTAALTTAAATAIPATAQTAAPARLAGADLHAV